LLSKWTLLERGLDYHWNHGAHALRRRRCVRDDERVRGLLLTLGREAVSVQGQKGAERAGRKGLSRNSVRQVRTLLSAFFDSAIRDELREDNPAHNVFRRSRTKAARMKARPRVGESVKAMTAAERDRFLTTALAIAPQWFTAWTLMALAGLRRNEALGLRWESVRLAARQIVVREQLDAGSTKSGEARVVNLAEPPAEHLRTLRGRLREEAFRRCEPLDERERVCCPGLPDQQSRSQVQTTLSRPTRAMRRVLKRAGLPGHFTMHSLRHSFCSLLISSGVSPVYVQQQAGHADVSFTVRVYGSWFPLLLVPLHVVLHLLDEGQAAHVGHAVEVDVAVEVVALVLDDAREEVLGLEGEGIAMAVEGIELQPLESRHDASEIRYGEAALPAGLALVAEGRHDGVHEHEEGHLGPRPVVAGRDLDDGEANALVNLRRREAHPLVLVHRLLHVVDELLEQPVAERFPRHGLGRRAEDRVRDAGDLQDGH
jgi:integrase